MKLKTLVSDYIFDQSYEEALSLEKKLNVLNLK